MTDTKFFHRHDMNSKICFWGCNNREVWEGLKEKTSEKIEVKPTVGELQEDLCAGNYINY